MRTAEKGKLQELVWDDVRHEVASLNPTLANIIDELSPNSQYKLFKASYPYGTEILRNGKFYLPNENGDFVPLVSDQINQRVRESLDYNIGTNPVTFVLKKSLELFVTVEDRIIPYSIITPGVIFGLWRILDYPAYGNVSHAPVSLWDMTAGARSIFMLPKITEEAAHERLKRKYQFNIDKPKNLKEHWYIFKEIANNSNSERAWNTELLFFSKKWFEKLNDKRWRNFKLYLLESAWRGSQFWRNQFTWDLTFSRIHSARGIKPPAFIADIVKHLLAIGVGAIPGFAPAINDDYAPIQYIQNAYLNEYNLKTYAPIIMQPQIFSMTKITNPVYYSMQFQTSIELSQKSSQRSSIITDMYAVNSLLKKYLEDIKKDYLNITATPLSELAKIVDYTFFHSSAELYSGIVSSEVILDNDSAFIKACKSFKNRTISKNSPFFNGCIRISSSSKV